MKRFGYLVSFFLLSTGFVGATNLQVTLTWDWPTNDVQGSAIQGPLGARVYAGWTEQFGIYELFCVVPTSGFPTNNRAVVETRPGYNRFAVTAFDVAGAESEFSNELLIPRFPPGPPSILRKWVEQPKKRLTR